MKFKSILLVGLLAFLLSCNSPANTIPTPTFALPTIVQTAAPTFLSTPTTALTNRPTDQPTLVRPTRAPSPTSAKPSIQTPAWFNDVVLYEIFPRSFYDTNNNGIGDLQGITQKLDYLQELGIGALWLTPIFASPSYHGYDTTDYYKINPEFGTEQDFIALVDEAHKHNIKIILDFVAGHTSNKHPFFVDAFKNPQSKYANWYRWLNDEHTSYEHFGSATDLPSLNQDNPETRAYLIDVAKYWIDKTHLDGYRLDYALGVSHDFWKTFRAELKKENLDLLLLGEVWTSGLKIAPYYDNEFDATFDFPLYFDLMGNHQRVGSSTLLGKGSLASFQSSLRAQTRLYNPGAQSVRFLNNHDTVRVMSQLLADCLAPPGAQIIKCTTQETPRAKLAATLLFTLPATPMIYYGEEIGMLGDKSDGDKTVREPMDWYASQWGAGMTTWYRPSLRLNTALDGISVEEQQNKNDSLLQHYRALIALRAKYDALRHGEFIPLTVSNNPQTVAYLRQDETETFIVLLNFGAQSATVPLDLNLLPIAVSGFTDELTGTTIPLPGNKSIIIAPLTAQLLRVQK